MGEVPIGDSARELAIGEAPIGGSARELAIGTMPIANLRFRHRRTFVSL